MSAVDRLVVPVTGRRDTYVAPPQESGEATTRKSTFSWMRYLDQGEYWLPKGRPKVAIADMDLAWRFNAARWLERRAKTVATWSALSMQPRSVHNRLVGGNPHVAAAPASPTTQPCHAWRRWSA